MNALLTIVLALGAGQPATGKAGATGAARDGKWLIVYAEEGGRRNNSWEQRLATLAKGTLSYEGDGGKKRSLKLEFGKDQRLKATAEDGVKWGGVYIQGQDYLCLSMSKAAAKGAGGVPGVTSDTVPQPPAGAGAGGQGSSAEFILILRRQRGPKAP
jgi:hypothetical protein